MTSSTETAVMWPAWSPANPADLARYVVPAVVARHAQIPGPSPESALVRLGGVWGALQDAGVAYALPRSGPEAGGQWVRPPGEVLVAPGSGTCLDLALVLAGACAHAGLQCAVLTLAPVEPGGPGHAVTAVLLDRSWPWVDARAVSARDSEGVSPHVWHQPPPGFMDEVQADVSGPPRAVVVLDPNQLARSSPGGQGAGDLGEAVRAGYAQLTSPGYGWGVAVAPQEGMGRFVPAPIPGVLPLRELYLTPTRETSALRLVRPEYRLTPFQGRDETTVLHDFCHRILQGTATGVAVVTGVGGAGKTRLALKLAERLQEEGWYAGALRVDGNDSASPVSPAWLAEVTAPLCVIVDYADARIQETQRLLQVVRRRPGPPAVVLLTARSAEGDWQEQILGSAVQDGHPVLTEQVTLPESHPRPGEILVRTWHELAPTDVADDEPLMLSSRADLPTRWTTLDLVLLGWLAAQRPGGSDASERLPASRADLYGEVLDHERRYWRKTYEERTGRMGHRQVLARAAAVLTLISPPSDQASETLRVIPELVDDAQWRFDVAETLRTCLAPSPGEGLAVRPDPVGDHHLLTVAESDPALIQSALAAAATAAELYKRLSVVNRAAGDPGAPDPRAVAILEAFVRTVVVPTAPAGEPLAPWAYVLAIGDAQGGAAEQALIELVEAGEQAVSVEELDQAIPVNATGLWRLGLVAVERRLTEGRAANMAPEHMAGLLGQVSLRRHHAGDRAGALAAIDEAVRLYGELAAANPAAFTPDLAGALNNQANRRSETGDRAGALAAIDEAVRLYGDLAAANPAAFTPDLAMALNNQANLRSETGDRAGALAAIDEAVRLSGDLAAANPAAFTPNLAAALNNQANLRSETGDRAGALAAIDEAVRLYGDLAAANPAAFTPNLAAALNNQANRRSETGDRAGALAAIDEAVRLYGDLAAANPAAFTPDLAMALNNQANRRSETGDRAGALAAIDEAVRLRRDLAAANPAAFTPNLAAALNNQANRRSETGDRAGALAAIDEAVRLYGDLAAANPAAFTPDLAAALNNQANRRSETGDRAGALAAIDEAVRLYGDLAAANPAAFTPNLAGALNNQANLRSETGDRAGALAAIDEAVRLSPRSRGREPGRVHPQPRGGVEQPGQPALGDRGPGRRPGRDR